LPPLSEEERRIYDAIDASETPIDQIAAKCDLPSGVVSSTLLRLELKRLVKQLPGKYFVKLG
jgi:DNA processing protein